MKTTAVARGANVGCHGRRLGICDAGGVAELRLPQ